jgi:hypothetical protein
VKKSNATNLKKLLKQVQDGVLNEDELMLEYNKLRTHQALRATR